MNEFLWFLKLYLSLVPDPEQPGDTVQSTVVTTRAGLETEKIVPALKRFHTIGKTTRLIPHFMVLVFTTFSIVFHALSLYDFGRIFV